MKLSISRHGLGLVCACVLSAGPLVSSGQAGLIPGFSALQSSAVGFWGFGGGYGFGYGGCCAAPVNYAGYTTGYGAHSCGVGHCGHGGYSSGFGGLSSLFGYGYPSSSCYTPSCCASPVCGTCSDSCSTCGWNGCAGAYAGGLCSSGGMVGNCPGGDCGISSVPYSAEPIPDDRSSSPSPSGSGNVPNRTYREDNLGGSDEGFRQPQVMPGAGSGSSDGREPARGFDPGQGGFGSTIMPSQGDSERTAPTDMDIERGDGSQFNFKIPAKNPVESEPTPDGEGSLRDPKTFEILNIESKLTFRAEPERRRAHYRPVFRAPAVVKVSVDVGVDSGWTPIVTDTKIAASR